MEFVILGPTALYLDGQPIPLGPAKQRAMLAVLLYHVGEPVRVDTIVEHLWDARTVADRRSSLYAMASRIRGVLVQAGAGRALERLPSTGAYRLNVDPNSIDFHRFRRLVRDARQAGAQHHHDSAAALLTDAVDLWRDEPIADLRSGRAEHIRRHMNEALLDAHRLLAASLLGLGRHNSALARLEPLIRVHEIDETLAQHWITALWAAGRETEARRFFLDFQRRFRRAIHAEPAVTLPAPVPQIRAAAPVPRSVLSGPHQLRPDIVDFAGHTDLLIELSRLTDPDDKHTNVVVIEGMPGVGKSTLAVHWAHRHLHRFPDGQICLNANGYGPTLPVSPYDALGTFLSALGVPSNRVPVGEDQRRDRLNQLLAGRRVLLVLDNIKDSNQARPLIPTSDTCVTLITSRNRLSGLAIREGVRSLTIPPLPDDECLILLRGIVESRRVDDDPAALRQLAQLSGGLPLAVRIIAEHVVARPLARIGDLVDELTGRLLDAEGGDDDNASLRTVFAWSYDALRPETARLFRILGLFPGTSIRPEAAAAMLGTGEREAEHSLNGLARTHLVDHSTVRRYRLHDLLRDFAAQRASAEETHETRTAALRRVLDWYLLSAVNAAAILAPDGPPVPDLPEPVGIEPQAFDEDLAAMRWCESERENLAALTRWAVGHGFARHGWQIPGTVHEIFERYGRQDDVREIQELALTAARLDDHVAGQVGTLINLGATYFAVRDYPRAAASFTESRRLAREIGDDDAATASSHNLATIHLRTGDAASAMEIDQQMLEACRATGNLPGEAAVLHRLGDAYRSTRQPDRAAEHYRLALAIRDRISSLRGQGITHGALAALFLEAGQYADALDHSRQALDLHSRTRDEAARCDALTTMADVQRALGLYFEALRDGKAAVAIGAELLDGERRCRALAVLAETHLGAGNIPEARRAMLDALTSLDELDDPSMGELRRRLLAVRDIILPPAAAG